MLFRCGTGRRQTGIIPGWWLHAVRHGYSRGLNLKYFKRKFKLQYFIWCTPSDFISKILNFSKVSRNLLKLKILVNTNAGIAINSSPSSGTISIEAWTSELKHFVTNSIQSSDAYDQFGKVDLAESSYYGQTYDYYSIMHYDSLAFSKVIPYSCFDRELHIFNHIV